MSLGLAPQALFVCDWRYGQLLRIVKLGPSSIATVPLCELGTLTFAVTVVTLPDVSVTFNVTT